jgi:integrase
LGRRQDHHQLDKTGTRTIPLFPELRAPLLEVSEQAPLGTVYAISRYRTADVNLRTQLLQILRKANVKPWPRLFHNLRATRETELAGEYPIHVVAQWLGHSALVAQKHYLQVRDEDFQRAAPAL